MSKTSKLTYRVIVGHIPDTGRSQVAELDTEQETPLILFGYKEWQRRTIKVAAGAVDTAFTFSNAVAMAAYSDQPVHFRLAAGESQVKNSLFFGWCAKLEDADVKSTSILISNPGPNEALIEIFYVERLT